MFVLVEQISPFKGVYDYDVFEEDIEINYSNILFRIRAYYLESTYSKIKDELDLIVFDNDYFFKKKTELSIMIEVLKKTILAELCELGLDEHTKININIVEG